MVTRLRHVPIGEKHSTKSMVNGTMVKNTLRKTAKLSSNGEITMK